MEWEDLSETSSSKTKMRRSVGFSAENARVKIGSNEIEEKKMSDNWNNLRFVTVSTFFIFSPGFSPPQLLRSQAPSGL